MAGIDMDAIKEAIARRKSGGNSPALGTQGAPAGNTPTGGPSTPTVQPPATPAPATPGTLPQVNRPPQRPQAPTGKSLKQVANFDEETKTLAKALITKLMSTL